MHIIFNSLCHKHFVKLFESQINGNILFNKLYENFY